MEFHISLKARKKYQFEDSLFTFDGNVIFANFHAARVFAQRINEKRDPVAQPALTARAGQVNAMGLIDEILHYIISLYRTQQAPRLYQDMEAVLVKQLGKRKLNALLRAFTREFPPNPVFKGVQSIDEYLAGKSNGIPNRLASLEELLLLWITNQNPACQFYQELFDDGNLTEKTAYSQMVAILQEFFVTQPTFGPDAQNLVDMLCSPAIAVPDSLHGQLDYIRSRWGDLLGHYLLKLLGSLNLFSEEEQLHGLGPGPVRVPVYGKGSLEDLETERFSRDAHWMPNLVLIAKNTYVWLDQLSRRFGRSITHLDHIPDEELDELAQWGFTGLWLIGLWERSRASARIKQACGNPDAIASAYSLKDYHIADDLGGEEALQNLRNRCQQRGIRLASDMVPNHMAIDSNWVIEHPDWFISLPFSPFPSYTFNGPFRERFLSYLLDGAVEKTGIRHDYPALWLRDHAVEQSSEVLENTSWSCHHGIERWRNVCGDAPSATWKKPVRDFLNSLADAIDSIFENRLHDLISDAWELRNDYVDVLLGITSVEELIDRHASQTLTPGQRSLVRLLLEAERDRLRMFSSDAWFFFDLDRIEMLNALKYAAHATGLVEQATGANPAYGIIDILAQAHSEVSSLTGDIAFLGYLKNFEMKIDQDGR